MQVPPQANRKSRSGCVLAALLAALLSIGGFYLWRTLGAGGAGIPIYLSAAQLQMGLDKAFPVDKRALFLKVHLSDPTVALNPTDGDRIGFGAHVVVSAAGKDLGGGTLVAAGKLRYDAPTGTLNLDDPNLQRLDIDRVPGSLAGPVRKAVSYILSKAIRRLPVYQIDTSDPMQKYAKRTIRSVRVTDGAVEVRFGLNP